MHRRLDGLWGNMYLYKNLSPFFNDIWLMLQVVLSGLANVDLHALITEEETDKQDVRFITPNSN